MAQAYSDLYRLYLSGQGIQLNNNGGFHRHGEIYGMETSCASPLRMLMREINAQAGGAQLISFICIE